MNVARLIQSIQMEAGWTNEAGHGLILETLNEVLRDLTALEYYAQLRMNNVSIAPIGLGIPRFLMPATLQHFLPDRVRYSSTGLSTDARFLYQGDVLGDDTGTPIRFNYTVSQVELWPQTIDSAGVIFIDYYKLPDVMATSVMEFPIPDLQSTVRLETVARLSRLSSSDKSKAFKAEAAVAFSRSQGAKK